MSKCLGKIPAEWHYSPPGAAGFHFCVFITWIRGSSTVPTLLIQRAAGCNAPWGLLGTCNTIIHLPLQTWLFVSPAPQWEATHEVGVFPNLLSNLPTSAGEVPQESFPFQAGNTEASKLKCKLFQPLTPAGTFLSPSHWEQYLTAKNLYSLICIC